MKKLDLDVLAMVVAVADTGSFAQGAQQVHRSPSAVSMQIRALEDALGKPLFVRDTRNVSLTDDGRTLADYGRRMLAMRDEAWASVVRPEIKGRVTIGVPDDYMSSLLPQVLGKFAATHPRVEVRVIGLPSSALVPMLKDNAVDLACLTRIKGVSGELIRREPIVWAGSSTRKVWEERPLPVAFFTHGGSMARDHAIKALNRRHIRFRMSYESPSFLGLLSMVEAGLAVAPLARCSIPEHLVQLSQGDGLPPLGELEVVLARSAQSARPPCDYLAEQILGEWRA
ncbi:LysR substrate-binding domain-containing protein [Burkholderia pseudomultivorans]|uniref:HTH-type transcriptional regulator GltC n=1 Tax=Burkholderia pseudomultivorans TaxID=1207504 RepID=A0A132EID7_9BURK|nr:LysR substrate-binding domain-containing protein [Burkholderia pseudomultivorans]KWF30882.1 LysR family transcriptional regulator [Burkholderia pseudomultivorans]MDR8726826.1 HTH-type transcriptional regulator GltC [Burkholderia pseudomultivorans]MDR8736069.1 HTH-type transcriptional regulator GltC [Burkholderia pseudomultivorans]MDR8742045.1 HTH-type transcriptional regulator GltC [Burkholderia pseudomultivorans]MDR8753156.1 HTH-type transcriptional regulator GltC [Burkholderia pseudomulti